MTAMQHSPEPDRPAAQPRVIRTTLPVHRWECGCQDPPVLLATWTDTGRVNIKVRDRYWHIVGCAVIQTTCPRCASEHELDMARLTELAQRP
jgi:hypothetical protein